MTLTRKLLIGAAVLVALVASAPAQAAPFGLKVYTANVENILEHHEACPGDWRELISWIAEHRRADLILLQQVDGVEDAARFTDRLNQLTNDGIYTHIVAEPRDANGTERCKGEKRSQTNAIVFNTRYLTLVSLSAGTWRSVHAGPGPGQCEENPQSRTVNLKARFELGATGLSVTAASVHWPTAASGGKPCDDDNARLLDSELKQPGYADSDVQIVGGDLNATAKKQNGSAKLWYTEIGKVGFRDAQADGPRTWTHILDDGAGAKRRIDYLFSRLGTSGPASFFNPYTLTFAMAERAQQRATSGPGAGEADPPSCHTYKKAPQKGCAYSEHRAVAAKVVF